MALCGEIVRPVCRFHPDLASAQQRGPRSTQAPSLHWLRLPAMHRRTPLAAVRFGPMGHDFVSLVVTGSMQVPRRSLNQAPLSWHV